MKRIALIILVALLSLAIAFTGCSKKDSPTGDDGNGGGNAFNQKFTFTLTGDLAGSIDDASQFAAASNNGGTAVTGFFVLNNVTYMLTIVIAMDPPKTGSFPVVDNGALNTDNAAATIHNEANPANAYWSDSGTVTITEAGNYLKGSFNIVLSEAGTAAQVTINGSFELVHVVL